MVFSDPSFLFLFLPLVLIGYFAVPRQLKNPVLLASSLLFYAWEEKLFVLVMLGSILFNYGVGIAVDRWHGHSSGRTIFTLGIVGNLLALAIFKYANFLVENLNVALVALGISPIHMSHVHLPIGISFFTFQAMSYLIDLRRRDVAVQRNLLDFALYKSLFPQLIAGPIVRYRTVEHEIHLRRVSVEDFAAGVQRFVIGLAKKTMIANGAGLRADMIFALPAAELTTPIAWLGIVCYTLQIYFDFSGYSDMAIGLGRMFGFHFLENFRYPYSAGSITDFWRRWHISLSSWFRDYIYIPLGGNRKSGVRTYFNLVVIFTLCGLWHGASWNFLIWGLCHGALLVIERLGWIRVVEGAPALLRHGYVMLAVMVTWVFFRADTLPQSWAYLSAMARQVNTDSRAQPLGFFLDPEILLILLAGVIGSTPLPAKLYSRLVTGMSAMVRNTVELAVFGLLLFGCVDLVAAGTYNPFIYFRF